MRVLWLFALVAALSTPAAVHAQGCQHTPPEADEDLEAVGSMFYDPESVENRGSVIQLLSPSDTAYVVRNDSTCQAVLDRVIPYLRRHHAIWKAGEEGNFSASIYRFGPYYAVEIMPEDRSPPATSISGVIKHGHDGALLIYRASDLALLRVLG
jgi:hypothetical protein